MRQDCDRVEIGGSSSVGAGSWIGIACGASRGDLEVGCWIDLRIFEEELWVEERVDLSVGLIKNGAQPWDQSGRRTGLVGLAEVSRLSCARGGRQAKGTRSLYMLQLPDSSTITTVPDRNRWAAAQRRRSADEGVR